LKKAQAQLKSVRSARLLASINYDTAVIRT
jgi:hypothetical protein